MNWTGKWHNPAYSGEGIDIAEYSDGKVIAHWYGYTSDDSQAWVVAVGERRGSTATLEAWITRGPVGKHTETACGKFILQEQNNVLRAMYEPYSGTASTRTLQPLYVPSTQPQPATEIVIRNAHGNYTGVPCEGANVRDGDKFSLEVVKGTLTITDIVSYGRFNPRVLGLTKGNVLMAGEIPRTVTFRLDPGWEQVGGTWEAAGLTVHTKELGPIFNLAAQVRRA